MQCVVEMWCLQVGYSTVAQCVNAACRIWKIQRLQVSSAVPCPPAALLPCCPTYCSSALLPYCLPTALLLPLVLLPLTRVQLQWIRQDQTRKDNDYPHTHPRTAVVKDILSGGATEAPFNEKQFRAKEQISTKLYR